MKVNKRAMKRARINKKLLSELTVKEYREIMQEILDTDRIVVQDRKYAEDNLRRSREI